MTSQELRDAQKELGYTAEFICGEAGISLSTWHKVIRGDSINKNSEKHLREALFRLAQQKKASNE